MELNNKTIAITGAGRGLGAAMATRLAGQGCNLALIDLDESALAETASACEAAGSLKATTHVANVSSEPDTASSTMPASHGMR
jgi:3-oxoacyl-[acyl-carrier protein] reductase